MRRSIIFVLVLGLIFGGLASAEGKKKRKPKRIERTVEYEYMAPSPGISGLVGACMTVLGVEGTACQDIPLGAGEMFASVTVTDATGQQTNFDLAQDSDAANPGLEIFASGCGETSDPVALTPGLALRVSVTAIGGPDCPGVGTTGTVKVTFSNLP
ncbi:MAG: hypothetical protein ACRDI3_06425 [Actinomycetota bacterium]